LAAAAAHHALLAAAVAALGAAGLRAAALASPAALERAVAAAPLAAGTAVLESLLLGLVGLGGSAVALALAAGATWAAARVLLPAPTIPLGRHLARWWRKADRARRAALGALVGMLAAWGAWMLRYPGLGYDSVLYHLPEAVVWVQGGSPGSVEPIVAGLPVGSYPLSYEVLVSWALGLDRSLVPVPLITGALVVLLGASGWLGLRVVSAPARVAGLAVAALVASPAVVAQGESGASLDGAALAWLVTCAALCAASRERPALLAPALVAGGLAAGTKTTALPLTLVVLVLGIVWGRRRARALARPLGAAAAVALAVGGFWYLRDLVDHGSPLWPYMTLPGGDEAPAVIRAADISFLDRPGETLSRLDSYYLRHFGGGIALLLGAFLVALPSRRGAAIAAALAGLGSLLLWLNAPLTGVSDQPIFDRGTGDATRYLLPALAAATLALVLAARDGGPVGRLAIAFLAAALGLNVYQTLDLGFPSVPAPSTPLVGAAAGAAAALAVGWVAARPAGRSPPVTWRALGATLVAAGAVALAPAAQGFGERHARAGLFDAGLVRWINSRPSFDEGEEPVAVSGSLNALLAGDRLRHPLVLLPPSTPCREVEQRLRRGWVVFATLISPGPRDVSRCLPHGRSSYVDSNYRAYAPGS
jgi:hypothetical protein